MSHLTPIYDAWDGNAEAMAADIEEKPVTVRQWRNRGHIPPQYWRRIMAEAAKRGRAFTADDFLPPEPDAEQAAA